MANNTKSQEIRQQVSKTDNCTSTSSITRKAFSVKHTETIAFFYKSEDSEIDNMIKAAEQLSNK